MFISLYCKGNVCIPPHTLFKNRGKRNAFRSPILITQRQKLQQKQHMGFCIWINERDINNYDAFSLELENKSDCRLKAGFTHLLVCFSSRTLESPSVIKSYRCNHLYTLEVVPPKETALVLMYKDMNRPLQG